MPGSNFSVVNGADGTTTVPISTPSNDAYGNTVVGHLAMIASGGLAVPIDDLHPLPVTSLVTAQTTQAGRTTNATCGVFDIAIPTPASGTIRKGGALWNTSPQTLLIYFGPHDGATEAAAIPLSPGDSISCTLASGVVLQDEVAVACATDISQTYVVTYQ